jgi:predicted MFS family arabinose efflux permease
MASSSSTTESPGKWYAEVTRYQWLVLAIASAGWVFDTFEGQIFNITRSHLLMEILKVGPGAPEAKKWGDIFLGVFLLGGTVGGILFGSLADRWGRRPTMVVTILMYSIFSGLTYFANTLWEVGVLRFLVAMGVGGEWAVAAALVAEVFPKKARAHASGIFHSTSILGTWLATFAGVWVGSNWRMAYLIGVVPALLVLWVRAGVKEPESWTHAKATANERLGSFKDLFSDPRWAKRAFLGMLLATVGLASFWGVVVATQDLTTMILIKDGVDPKQAAQTAKSAYGFIQTAGAGLGLLSFGPLCVWLGRRKAFAVVHVGAAIMVPITCYGPASYSQLVWLLPIFGFFTLSMHAGYAIYFPELFPNHLRATGTGFCFNGGRILSALMLLFSGWFKSQPGMDLRFAMSVLGLTFVLGLAVIYFMPETKDQPLPE